MTRSIVKYQFMADERARNVTLRKRKASLMKKMEELNCLCDVDAALVMFEKDDTRADVWPSPSEAWRIIQRYQNTTLVGARSMIDQKSFLKTSILKTQKHLEKEKGRNIKRLMISYAFDESASDYGDLEGMPDALESEIKLLDLMLLEKEKRS